MNPATRYRPQRKLAYLLILFVIVPFGYLYLVQGVRFFAVPSASMSPTLIPADYLLTFPATEYQRGDVIVLEDPQRPGAFIVKRLIALEGDSVLTYGGGLFLDREYVSEPYLLEPMMYNMRDYVVKKGEVFVMGDNRNESLDSHNWIILPADPEGHPGHPMGVPADSIIGKVAAIYLPFGRTRRVDSYSLRNISGSIGRES